MSGEPESLRERKRRLRRAVLARRDALGEAARATASAAIVAAIAGLDVFRRARTVLAYRSFGSEPSTDALLAAVLREGRTLVLPRVEPGRGGLGLYRVDDPASQLRPGTWGIPEPDPAVCPEVTPSRVDFVLVPGVAFDLRGGRMGYGGGYYDRLLPRLAEGVARVAGAFEIQLVAEVPMGPGDRRVDIVVTEARVWRAGPTRG